MTVARALEIMETSKSVEDWNRNRHWVMENSTLPQWQEIFPEIDGKGLIVKVLGRDSKHVKF